MMPMRFALAGLLCCMLLLQGCAHRRVNDLAIALPSSGPEKTLIQLEKLSGPDRDRAQYLLDRGVLKLYVGDLQGVLEDLEQAKGIMAVLQAASISENLAAVTTNDTLRSYSGTPSDQALVHFYLALTYLLTGDLDGARVESLQSDVTMQSLTEGDSVSGQMASMRFLSGLIYEMNGEYDDALISYRRAYNIMKARSEIVPGALQISLLNLTRKQGFFDEYQKYQTEFGREDTLPGPGEGEWVLFYQDGVVSTKIENRFTVFDAGLNTMVTVVMPDYPSFYYQPQYAFVQSADYGQRTDVLEGLERRAREDLDEKRPGILAAATARAVAKYIAVKSAQDQNDLAGLLAMIAAFASEQADLRSWNMLPSSIQVARIRAPAGVSVDIPQLGFRSPPASEYTPEALSLLFATSLSSRVFSYPPIVYPEPENDAVVEAINEDVKQEAKQEFDQEVNQEVNDAINEEVAEATNNKPEAGESDAQPVDSQDTAEEIMEADEQ